MFSPTNGLMERGGRWLETYSHVVLTGGSSGIGNCFITTIRKCTKRLRICNLSRSEVVDFGFGEADLDLRCDLARPAERAEALGRVEAWLGGGDSGNVLIINNAGFGSYGEFAEMERVKELELLEVNCRAPVEITHRLLPVLQRRGGAVVNVASTAAFQPTPYMASYGASKAFLLHWSLALNEELKGAGIPVMALCPGPTESQFFRRAGFEDRPLAGWGQTAQQVVDTALRSLARRHPCPVSGWSNRVLVAASGLLPMRWQAVVAGRVLKRVRLGKKG